jgi:tRNA modification GTPase
LPVADLDTIAAIATPPGAGGVGIIRISGPAARHIGATVAGLKLAPRHAHFARFRDGAGAVLDEGIVVSFPSPHSFTGEDVVELQAHGGPVVLDMLLRRAIELGARLARPGEFSERAFLNGKLDLAQAEAVADLIAAGTEAAARSAVHSLQGTFSAAINDIVEAITRLRMYVEAAIDFPEDEIDFLADERLLDQIDAIEEKLETLRASARQGSLLRDGINLVLAGRPNAGKSSLLNALAGQETAIVSEIPGTTRDVIRERIQIDGLPVHVLDTAGLRDSGDVVEIEGVRRARSAMEQADRVLLVVDDAATSDDDVEQLVSELPPGIPRTIVRNKIDISGREPGFIDTRCYKEVSISARTGAGLELLRQHLKDCVGYRGAESGVFLARRRHLDAIDRAYRHVVAGREQLRTSRAGELLAEELREAQQDLGEITGAFTSDDLLGRIFADFCIGK